MPKEKNKVDINKHEIDIGTLFKQNVNDLSAIKELYKKLNGIQEKISQIKYIDTKLADKLKKDYEKLKKIILDENIQVKLTNDIKTINLQLDTIAIDLQSNCFIAPYPTGLNDTMLIQEKINLAKVKGGIVKLQANQVYKLNRQGVKSFKRVNNTLYPYGYCLEIPSNVTLDLNGSTLFVNKNQDSAIVINENPDCSGNFDNYNDRNITIKNGVLNQNMENQSNTYWQCGIYLASVTDFKIKNIKILNANMCGLKLDKVNNGYIDNLIISNIKGHGCYWGNKVDYDLMVRNITVGYMLVENCKSDYCFPPMASTTIADGNSLHFMGENCSFRHFVDKNTHMGTKISNECKNINFEYVYVENSGFKFQDHGIKETRPKYINIGTIDIYNCIEGNFRIETAEQISVNTINMYNCTANKYNLMWFSGENININNINLIGCSGTKGVLFRSDANNVNIGNFIINSNVSCELSKGSMIDINKLTLKRDNITDETWQRGLNNVGSNCNIGTVYVYGENEKYLYNAPICASIVNNEGSYKIGNIFFDGIDLNGKVISLNKGTKTTISDRCIYTNNYGTNIYLYPLISLIPQNTESRKITLDYIITNNGSIVINHSQATGTEKFILKVDKYITSVETIK